MILVIDKVREMSYGLPNMSEMLTYADQEVKDMAAERRIKRRADFEKKSSAGGPPSKMQKTDDSRLVFFAVLFLEENRIYDSMNILGIIQVRWRKASSTKSTSRN